MPPIPNLALAIKALISFVVLGISITAINAVGFSNNVYTKGPTGTLYTPPVSPPAVEFGQSSDCPACLLVNLDNVRVAPTPTLPLKISWAAPSMVRPKLSPTLVAPPPGTTSTAPSLVSNLSKAEEFTLWCKVSSPFIFRGDAAWMIVGGIFLIFFLTASTYLLLHRLPSLKSYLTKAKDIGRGILSQGQLAPKAKQSLEILMAILHGRLADLSILALAIFRHMELPYDPELERHSEWKAATKQRLLNEANARLNEIFWEWQVAEEKRSSDWQAAEKKRILDKTNALIQEHAREYVQQEKMKIFRKVTDIIDNHRRDPKTMRSELHKLWDAEFDQVSTSETTSQGEVQQPKTDQRLPNLESTPKQKEEAGEAQQPEAAQADSEQAAELNKKHEEAAAPKSELANESAKATPEAEKDGAEAHQSQVLSELGADTSHPKECGDEGEARGSEHADRLAEQTTNLDDDEENPNVQQSEGAHVSQALAVKLEESADDVQSQRPEDSDGGFTKQTQTDAEEGTRVPENQKIGPKDEGDEGHQVTEDVREQDDNESATRRALTEELEESVAELYRRVIDTKDNDSISAEASQARRSVQNCADFCINWYDVQISCLKNAHGNPSSDPYSNATPPNSATTTKEDRDAWYKKRLYETHVRIERLKKIIDYREKRQTMRAKFVSFGWDLGTSTRSFSDTESENDETGHEETQERPSTPQGSYPGTETGDKSGHEEVQDQPSTPQGSYPASETEIQSPGTSKTKKRNLERKRAKAKKVEETLESQH